jgi:hypothetical protein
VSRTAADRLQGLGLDAFSIVANTHPKQAMIVPDVRFQVACLCVLESISQQLAGDPVNLILEVRGQRLPLPFHGHPEDRRSALRFVVCDMGARQILTRNGQQLLEIASSWRRVVGGAYSAERPGRYKSFETHRDRPF